MELWNFRSWSFSTKGTTYISRAAITLGIGPHSFLPIGLTARQNAGRLLRSRSRGCTDRREILRGVDFSTSTCTPIGAKLGTWDLKAVNFFYKIWNTNAIRGVSLARFLRNFQGWSIVPWPVDILNQVGFVQGVPTLREFNLRGAFPQIFKRP